MCWGGVLEWCIRVGVLICIGFGVLGWCYGGVCCGGVLEWCIGVMCWCDVVCCGWWCAEVVCWCGMLGLLYWGWRVGGGVLGLFEVVC